MEQFELPQTINKQEQPQSEIEREFKLKEQYEQQVKFLLELGLIELFVDGGMGYINENGDKIYVPEYQEVINRINNADQETINELLEYDYNKLYILPQFKPKYNFLKIIYLSLEKKITVKNNLSDREKHLKDLFNIVRNTYNVLSKNKLSEADEELKFDWQFGFIKDGPPGHAEYACLNDEETIFYILDIIANNQHLDGKVLDYFQADTRYCTEVHCIRI